MPPTKTLTPLFVAKVKDTAESQSSSSTNNTTIGRDVLERIQNCLRRAQHPETPEAEAQTALRMSSRLMERYNVSQADLIAVEVKSQEPSRRGGQSTVVVTKHVPQAKNITPTWLNKNAVALSEYLEEEGLSFEVCKKALEEAARTAKPSEKVKDKDWLEYVNDSLDDFLYHGSQNQHETLVQCITDALVEAEPSRAVRGEKWSSNLACAMIEFFDCKFYTVAQRHSRNFVFYGITVNTVAAAMAFETAFNLVEHWVLLVKTGKGCKDSYRLGVSHGMQNIARKEKEDELKRAREREAAATIVTEQTSTTSQHNLSSGSFDDTGVFGKQSEQQQGYDSSDEAYVKVKAEISDDVTGKDELTNEDFSPPSLKRPWDDFDDDTSMKATKEGIPGAYNCSSGLTDDEESDDDDDDTGYQGQASTFNTEDEKPIDLTLDLDEEIERHKPPQQTSKPESPSPNSNGHDLDPERAQRNADKESGMLWRDSGALTLYRKNATTIAEEFLNTKGVKLKSGRKYTAHARNNQAYQQGKEDSKKIDVKRRRIEN